MFSISNGLARQNAIFTKNLNIQITAKRKYTAGIDREGNTSLHRFLLSLNNLEKNSNLEKGEIIYSKALIAKEPAILDYQNKKGVSPAFISVYKQRFSLMKQFLKMGAKPFDSSCKTVLGESLKPMDVALYHRNMRLSHLLHEHGEEIPSNFNPYQFFSHTTMHLESIFHQKTDETYWEHLKCNKEDKDFLKGSINQGKRIFCAAPSFSAKAAKNPKLMKIMDETANYFLTVYGLAEYSYRGDRVLCTPMGYAVLSENYSKIRKLSEEEGWNALIEKELMRSKSHRVVREVRSYCQAARLGYVDLQREPQVKLTSIRTVFYENMVKLLNSNHATKISLISEFSRSMNQNLQIDILSTISLIKMLQISREDLSLYLCKIYYANEREMTKGKNLQVRKESLSLLLDYLHEENLTCYRKKFWGAVSPQARVCLFELLKHL